MTYVYDKSGQRIFFQREGSTYGKAYDPETELTAFTAVPADYAHWRRLDIIEDTFDVSVPLIEKLKKFDISDAKHASAVLSGNIKPVDITFEMTSQGLEFLPLAVGAPTLTSHKLEMDQNITCIEKSLITNNDYFLFDLIVADEVEHHLFWFDVTGAGSAPTVTGINAANRHEVDIQTDTTAADVADALATIMTGVTGITATDSGAVVTIEADNAGAVQMAHDGAAATDFIFGVDVWGSTDYGVVEAIDTSIPSITIHFEQRNTTTAEDIVYDCFGCVVDSINVSVVYGDQLSTYSVTFKCPYAIVGNKSTNDPPRKYIKGFPAMSSIQEAAGNYLIQENGTTIRDRTPKTVDSVILGINNNIAFRGDLSKRYLDFPIAAKREISLQIIGNTDERELFQYFLEEFTNDGTDWRPTSGYGRLNSKFKIQRDATYDYILISFYNWVGEAHNFSFVSVDDAVKSVDMTFTDGSSDSNGRIIDNFDYVSYIDKTVMVV